MIERREAIIGSAAIFAAVVAVWMTVRADFLAYPGWLAAQKADFILGPVFGGLYWLRRRPRSRFGPLMIAVGFLSVPYILHSSAAPWAFAIGVSWEGPIFLTTVALILAFPTGRFDGLPERLILALGFITVVVPIFLVWTVSPQIAAGASISGCSGACPANAFLISPHPALVGDVSDAVRIAIAVLDLATMALVAWRFATGSPPRRRALAIGTPIALLFLATQVAYQVAELLTLERGPLITWGYVVARAAVWYGFVLALVAAELFAARVLRHVVEASLKRPSLREIEAMLRGPLGDPGLRLAFRSPDGRDWVDGDGVGIEAPSGRTLTAVEREGRPAVAVIHDPQLAEDPELVHAAGAVALLARENADLEVAWTDSLHQLRESRARIAAARDLERRALERDLHDGAQQQLTAALVHLSLIGELLPEGSPVQTRLSGIESELEHTLHELRRLAHGIYPSRLGEVGVVGALAAVANRSAGEIQVAGDGVGRYAPEVEAAVYYCCLEALQNATKHAGRGAAVVIALHDAGDELRFEVRDDGPGFDPTTVHDGVGLRNLRDRVDALHGRLEIITAPGRGSVIVGAVPVPGHPAERPDSSPSARARSTAPRRSGTSSLR